MDYKKIKDRLDVLISLVTIAIILMLLSIAVNTVVQSERYQPDIDLVCPMSGEIMPLFEEIKEKLIMCEESVDGDDK